MAAVQEIVRQLVEAGRAHDLHDLLTGVSPYCRVTGADMPPGENGAKADDPELWKSHRLWTLAIHHLDFLTRYGRDQNEVWEGSILRCAYPDEFEEWLRAGAPGLSAEALAAYLHDHPAAGNGTTHPRATEPPSATMIPR